ncbi:MAG: TPM domain-containing protein [Sinimarinibacterium flocculans]|uniref:TPM domain-containing protein n=1 Tax=Sinimarinibacterium flocculans TaxID=985250 RepID=UPI003C58F414
MRLLRAIRHLCTGSLMVRRRFDRQTLAAIEEAVRRVESLHAGQIRFAVEPGLPLSALWRGQTPRERAIEVFSELRVWDTEHNDGVLIYLLFADRDVEIVADRGVAGGVVSAAQWEACCQVMESRFRTGAFREGAIAGIEAVAAVLARHPPGRAASNELPDAPALL